LGIITLEKKYAEEEELFEFIIENGSEDFEVADDQYLIYCDHTDLHSLDEKIINKFDQTANRELIWKSENNVNVEKDIAEKLFKLLNQLEENEDVQIVSSNFEVSEETLSSLTM
jgi:Uncharacterized conserved protein